MDLSITAKVMWAGFVVALLIGMLVNKTGFCTMGGISDAVNIGDRGRLGAWFLAIAVAMLGVVALQAGGAVDMSLTAANESSQPPYRIPMFVWPRYLVGGLLFGIGMTLGSGCGNKTVVRLGGGNLKSVFVLAMIGAGAYLMMFTNFGYYVFLQWMTPLGIDFAGYGVASQDMGSLAAATVGASPAAGQYVVGTLLGLALLAWALRQPGLRGSFDNLLGGLAVGGGVVALWYVTAGPLGQEWLAEIEWMEQRPLAAGAQSLTFIAPTGQLYHWLSNPGSLHLVTLAMVILGGVLAGSFLYAFLTRAFRVEWFVDLRDFAAHLAGGLLMGVGGVLAMGCSIGQGVTGMSTLSLGSLVALVSIMLGSAVTMKVQYYKMIYESEANVVTALLSSLVDFHLLPKGLRRLQPV